MWRGSQVGLARGAFPWAGVIADGVIVDFREPIIVRWIFTALQPFSDADQAMRRSTVLTSERHRYLGLNSIDQAWLMTHR